MAILTREALDALWINGFIPDEDDYIDRADTLIAWASGSGGDFIDVALSPTSRGTIQYRLSGNKVHLRFINYIKGTGVLDSIPLEIAPLAGNEEGSNFLLLDGELTGQIVNLFIGSNGDVNPQETTGSPFPETPNITKDIYYFI